MSIFKRKPYCIKHKVYLHPRFAEDAAKLIDMLARDDEDGKARRASIYHWLRSERPVIEEFFGFYHHLRVDGPAFRMTRELIFPMGSLLQATNVRAHLDPIESKKIEERLRKAIDDVLCAWIAEHQLWNDGPPVPLDVDRAMADSLAMRKIANWNARRRLGEPVDWGKADA